MVDLEARFDIGLYNGSMTLTIIVNDEIVHDVRKFTETQHQFRTQIDLPAKIKFIVGNKNMNADTLVDNQGQVLKDKFVKLSRLWLGRVEVQPFMLKKHVFFNNNGVIEQELYWGRPGHAEINFDNSSVVEWHLLNNFEPDNTFVNPY